MSAQVGTAMTPTKSVFQIIIALAFGMGRPLNPFLQSE